jgi:hypothetical protein
MADKVEFMLKYIHLSPAHLPERSPILHIVRCRPLRRMYL